jgi:molybdopterin-containing oxidoreductase family membrane subunit
MWFLLFIKQLPVMAIAELKEVIPPRMKHTFGTHSHHPDFASLPNPVHNEPPEGDAF